jgi:L-iditol 2-dehydrogenase
MKTMVLTGIRRMEMREAPMPALERPTDVLIRMGTVGVCGSDLHYYTQGRIGSQVVRYPFTIGHECAGTVDAVGPAVTRVKPGERIAVEPAVHCGACDQCRIGRHHTCRHNRFLGCPGQLSGALAEFLVMPEVNCFPIRDETTFARGTISEPLAIGVYAVKLAALPAGARVGILGMGPIGMSVLLPAIHAGHGPVYCTDRIPARLALAATAGAAYAGNIDQADTTAEILAHEPHGLDVIFECCGRQEALDQAVLLLKPGGRLMIIGIPEVDRISFPVDRMRRAELCIQNVRRQVGCVEEALDLIENRKVDVDPMITHTFPFEQTREAFDLVADYRDGVLKAMIQVA